MIIFSARESFTDFRLIVKPPSEPISIERVFGFVSDNPDDYPEKTFLQKKMKESIKNEKKITEGIGIGRFKCNML